MRHATWIAVVPWFVLAAGCASGPDIPPAHFHKQLRQAMTEPVPDRATRDQQSRRMVEALDGAELEGLNRGQVRAAIGKGQACVADVCGEHGFSSGDWYYEMGQATGDDVQQLPVLIVGFDHRDLAVRVWTLTTHE